MGLSHATARSARPSAWIALCALAAACGTGEVGPAAAPGAGGAQAGGAAGASGSQQGGAAGNAGSQAGGAAGNAGSQAGGAAGNAGISAGGGGTAGAAANGGGSGGVAGAGTTGGTGGIAGSAGAGGAAGAVDGGQGGTPDAGTGATDIAVEPHTLSVTGGTVFNLTDDYFDDGLVPPSPLANFGFHSPIITVARADGSLDVAWLDYAGGKGKPFGLSTSAMINITHVNADLATATTTSTGLNSYRLLGFTIDPTGAYYIAYTVDHPFKSATGENNINGNELHIAKATTPSFAPKAWDKLIFGAMDNTKDLSKGDPGGAGSGVLGFDATNQRIVLYVAHSMAWGDNGTRHQAGYFRLHDAATGAEIVQNGGSSMNMGAGWFYSHNFDQRMIVEPGKYYLLAHGDAYARQLGFAAWSPAGYLKNSSDFDKSYWTIPGNVGDNTTNAETGQFVKLASGKFAIVHTTSDGRTARDVRIVLADGATGVTASEAWLTTNTGKIQGNMPKVEILGDRLLITYGLWDSTSRTNRVFNWYAMLLDQTLKTVMAPKAVPGVEFVKPAPLFRFAGGPNAGRVGWVSGNATHTLTVNVVRATN